MSAIIIDYGGEELVLAAGTLGVMERINRLLQTVDVHRI